MNFRDDINGLRALAVLGVMLFHFRVPGFRGGFAGVDIFFVISGFLMTRIIVGRLEAERFSLPGFWFDRARRIVPALLVMIAAVLAAGYALLPPEEYRTLGKHAAAAALFVSNILFFREVGYFDAGAIDKWLLHTWSLGAEWQFYILYPVVLLVGWRLGRRRVLGPLVALLAFASFALCLRIDRSVPGAAFYLLPPRAWEMLVGGLVALYPLRLRSAVSHLLAIGGLLAVIASLFVVEDGTGWPGWATLLPVLATAAVIASDRARLVPLGWPPIAALGTISYSVYLWHWPIVAALALFERLDDPVWRAIGLGMAILLGALSYALVERPTRDLGRRSGAPASPWHPRPAQHAVLALATAAVLVPALAVWRSDGLPSRVPPAVASYAADSHPDPTLTRDCFQDGDVTRPCFLNAASGAPVGAILIGDSHALAVAPAVAQAMARQGRGTLWFRAYPQCPTMIDAGYPDRPSDRCLDFNRAHLPSLLGPELGHVPVLIVNSVRGYMVLHDLGWEHAGRITGYTPALYRRRFTETVCAIARQHPVTLMDGYPDWEFDVPHRMARRLMRSATPADIQQSLAAHRARHAEEHALVAEVAEECGATVLDPAPYLCGAGQCAGTIDRAALYYDAYHLNDRGAARLEPMFERWLAKAPAHP